MLQYQKIDASEGIDVNKTSASKECELCHYWFLKMLDLNLKSMFIMSILSAKGATFRCLLMGTSKNEVIKKLNNSVTYDRGVL